MIDIGSLARAARLRRSRGALAVLWREVFSLRSWFFVAEPSPNSASRGIPEVRPLVVEREGRRRVLVFTDEFAALQHERRAAGGLGVRGIEARKTSTCAGARVDQPAASTTEAAGDVGPATSPVPRSLVTLELDIDAALKLFDRLARDGVFAATFDDGQESFEAPLGMLRRLKAAVDGARKSRPTDAAVDKRSASTRRAGSKSAVRSDVGAGVSAGTSAGASGGGEPVASDDDTVDLDAAALEATTVLGPPRGQLDLAEIIERGSAGGVDRDIAAAALLRLDDWWFICNPRDPDAIYIRRFDGTPAVVAFTDERRAIMATERHGLIDSDGCILLLQLPVQDAVRWMQSFRDQDVHDLAFEANGVVFRLSIEELATRWGALMGESPEASGE